MASGYQVKTALNHMRFLFPHLPNLGHWVVCVNWFHPLGFWGTAGAFTRSEQSVLGVQGRRSGLAGSTRRNALCSLQACEKVIIPLNCFFLYSWCDSLECPDISDLLFLPTVKRSWCHFNHFINDIVPLSAVTSSLRAEFVKANFKKRPFYLSICYAVGMWLI